MRVNLPTGKVVNKNTAWVVIIAGILVICLLGVPVIIFDGGPYPEVYVPKWVGWSLTLIGGIFCGIGFLDMFHKKSYPNTNAEAAKAKAKMDQMYFNEYGVWPDYKEVTEILPENEAKSDQASAGSEAGNANLKSTSPVDTKSPVD